MRACRNYCWLLVACLFPSIDGHADDEAIPWSAERPLTWADFQDHVPRRAEDKQVAMTAASIGWSYGYQVTYSDRDCVYAITDISVTAAFHPGNSWVRPGHENSRVLAHEQGHFDIAQIFKLAMEAAMRDELGLARPCSGRDNGRATKAIEREIGARLNPIYERMWRSQLTLQDTYDRETGHGTDGEAQQRWTDWIAAGLRGDHSTGSILNIVPSGFPLP